jgi:16S rRNA (guanine1207-N2)-methyltransferase
MSSGQYFDPAPAVPSEPVAVEVLLPDLSFTLWTDRGTFSHGRLDTGTRLLLLEAPPPPATGTFLDLGCGAGPLAVALGLRARGATVWAVDVNERARALTARNAAGAGLANVHVAAPDEVPPDVVFDLVWSHPPIRIGKEALHALLLAWLGRLAPGGVAVLVVQRHLGADSLAAWLGREGYEVTRLSSRAGYRLLAVRHR